MIKTEILLIDIAFDLCVRFFEIIANFLKLSFEEIIIYFFLIIIPAILLILVAINCYLIKKVKKMKQIINNQSLEISEFNDKDSEKNVSPPFKIFFIILSIAIIILILTNN